MRRVPLIVLLLVASLSATSSAMAQTQPPALSAAVETCATSALPAGRVAGFVGSMPTLTGGERMSMRFDLERLRPRDTRWRPLRGVPGFGAWATSAAGRAGFVFHKRLDGLLVPASYRAIVRFRWTAAGGRLVRSARLRTAACAQPDLRPNLVPGPLTAVFATRPGFALYTLTVSNAGRTASGPFTVSVGGAPVEVEGLPAQAQRTVVVLTGICLAGTTLQAVVDPDHRIDESRERDNGAARRCPLWGA
jgi:hypothetical protein